MKEFDYVIIGGGCAGLSLAYELEIHNKLRDKTLAIIEPRLEYKRDKTWSYWKTLEHNFTDCVKKSWINFSINIPILNIVSGIPYDVINARNPARVPFDLSRYGMLWYILLYKDLLVSSIDITSFEADINVFTYSNPVGQVMILLFLEMEINYLLGSFLKMLCIVLDLKNYFDII